jgi:type II secretory pathway pseudopilin PulG
LLNTNKKAKGFLLVELVIATAIFMIYAGGLAVSAIGSHLTRLENAQALVAREYFTEGWEAIRTIRNENWSALANGDHGLAIVSNHWTFADTEDEFGIFTRTVSISDVQRDSLGSIVQSGGETDADSKSIKITVSWQDDASQPRSISAETLLTNYSSPSAWPPA